MGKKGKIRFNIPNSHKSRNLIYLDNWDVNKPRKPDAPNMQNWELDDPANSKDMYEVLKTGKLGIKANKVVSNKELTTRKVQHRDKTTTQFHTYTPPQQPKKMIFKSDKAIDEELVKLLKNFLKLKIMENFISREIYNHIYTLYK